MKAGFRTPLALGDFPPPQDRSLGTAFAYRAARAVNAQLMNLAQRRDN